MKSLAKQTTGINGLDEVINNLRLGDNVVCQIDKLSNYRYLAREFAKDAISKEKRVIYIRFASHEALFNNSDGVFTYNLDAKEGFETFSTKVHEIIKKEGIGVFYVFDCLSDLLLYWAADLMLGNFFVITCPYLFELDTIAYFAIMRDEHSFKTVARIRETTQLLLDVYSIDSTLCIHPLKVWNRYSSSMFLPHIKEKEKFIPITSSTDAARLFSYAATKFSENSERNLDYWDRLFLKVEEIERNASNEKKLEIIEKISKVMLAREKRILDLAQKNFNLQDFLDIKSRMIGTGFIGGKAVGMLLSRKILAKDISYDWNNSLEPHDSFYIGSDVYYTYIVQNGLWKLRMAQKTKEGYFKEANKLKESLLNGKMPEEIREQLMLMIEYFGQSPIIVRSSSLLEDSFGNAFAGKYESIFSVNQGTTEERYAKLEEFIKQIFASTMNEDALSYRLQRGLDTTDEQMALLIQRVSGTYHKNYFFPDAAGVGISYNTFAWKEKMDPKAGMLRIVFGLGTRAVNRVEDDYPRVVALDDPLTRPYHDSDYLMRFSQHKMDVLNIDSNNIETVSVAKILEYLPECKNKLFGSEDLITKEKMRELKMQGESAWNMNFDGLFSETDFGKIMSRMLKNLEDMYQYPVDIEFTTNFRDDGKFNINLLQCRPLQVRGAGEKITIPSNIDQNKILFETKGSFMGGNIAQKISKIIYVDPSLYYELAEKEKFLLARYIGQINKNISDRDKNPVVLIGPGRWGTSTPSLGVPVSFSEINNISVLVEIDYESGNIQPELSFGTHFFQDLVETDISYAAVFSGAKKGFFNTKFFEQFNNSIDSLIKEENLAKNAIYVYDTSSKNIQILSDILTQKMICFSS